MPGPCDDLRVIDLSSGPAGGLATMILADFGADVVKVEPPGGDPARAERAAPMWLRGKRSVTLDLAQPGDRERLAGLVRGADVVVSSAGPALVSATGTDYATCSRLNPALVYCSVTGWGLKGPYADYPADPALVAAKSGRMQAFAGISRREGPAFPAVRTETHAAAQSALSGILAALLVRDRTGEGQLVETSLLQGMFPYDLGTLVRGQLAQRYPAHFANDPYAALSVNSMPTLGYQPIMGKDGRWIQFANLLEHLFQASIIALDLTTEVLAEPRYAAAPRLAPAEAEEVRNLMLERARERAADEWMPIFHDNGNVAADHVGTAQRALHHADLVANGEVLDREHPRLGTVRQLGPLARLTRTPGTVTGLTSEPGEHTDAVLAEHRTVAAPAARNGAATPRHPLEGITVLEFATIIAVPLGASLLADLGARVIKVEPTGGGDPMRTLGVGLGAYIGAAKMNAGKESICIDLKSEHGQALVGKLIERADVIIHNYRPGVPERLGIGYERARALRPDIVHVSVNGYGPDGPSAHRPAAHPIPGAVCGGALMQVGSAWPPADLDSLDTLREAARQFYRANEANPDPNTSVAAASSALLGLYARRRTGEGQQIFLSMLGANGYANFDDFLAYRGKPERPTLDGELHGTGPLYRLYRAADGGWIFLAVHDEDEWVRLCRAAGRADLAADARFADGAARAANGDALAETLGALFRERPAAEWERVLIAAGVGCVEASTESPGVFFAKSAQLTANGLAIEADHALWGRYQRWGPMVTFSETPGRYGPGVLAGQHTDTILAEIGCSPDEIADLRAAGVVDSAVPMELGAPVA